MWLVMAVVSAWADAVVLDDGTVLRAHIVTWNDDCTLAVDEGPLADAWIVLPCARIASYQRDARADAPAALADVPEAEALPLAVPVGDTPASDDPEDQPLVDPSGVVEEPQDTEDAPPTALVDLTWREAMLAVRDRIRSTGR